MCGSFYEMLLPHFTVFYFMSCPNILKRKALLIKPTVCSMLMIDVTIDERNKL